MKTRTTQLWTMLVPKPTALCLEKFNAWVVNTCNITGGISFPNDDVIGFYSKDKKAYNIEDVETSEMIECLVACSVEDIKKITEEALVFFEQESIMFWGVGSCFFMQRQPE